jgi:hypothetical protein
MRFLVHHETQYRYSRPVSLGAHLLRLTPRADDAGVIAAEGGGAALAFLDRLNGVKTDRAACTAWW